MNRYFIVALLLSLFALPSFADAQRKMAGEGDERDPGWYFKAELTGLWTAGNSQSKTFGLASTLERVWTKSILRMDAGGARTESTLKSRTAIGVDQDNFTLTETSVTEKTAEYYFARGRYGYLVSERAYLFGGVDWLRNTFAGIDSRTLIGAGAGYIWLNTDQTRFNTDVSFTYTFQEDVISNPFTKNNFPGVRFAYDLWQQVSSTTEFTSQLFFDVNLDNTDDLRADWRNALPITISDQLFLKPAIQIQWRNDPSLTEVPLNGTLGEDNGTVVVPLEKIDTFTSISLVVKI